MKVSELSFAEVKAYLGERDPNCHKGDNGKGLLLAGSPGFSGAALMAAAAALRAGIGTLKLLCPEDIRQAFFTLPEAMVHGFQGAWEDLPEKMLTSMLEAADCIGVGPGLGRGAGVFAAVEKAAATRKPMVADADALNAIAATAQGTEILHPNMILTPHLGEMSRLCALPVKEIEVDMQGCALHYARTWNCTVLLKSAQSVIAAPDGRCRRNVTGNAGLAKGGSGDILTGITLAMLGQGLAPFEAACAGAYLLGASADEALHLLQERMLMARDVVEVIERTAGGMTRE